MPKVSVIVTKECRVTRSGLALIISSAENLEVVGREGGNILNEAQEFQPDLVLYEINRFDIEQLDVLRELKQKCAWTRVIIYASIYVEKSSMNSILTACDCYLQGPLIPGYLMKAVDLACFSGSFLFLGPACIFENIVHDKELPIRNLVK